MDMQRELNEVAKHVAANTKTHYNDCIGGMHCSCSVLDAAKRGLEKDWRKRGLWEE